MINLNLFCTIQTMFERNTLISSSVLDILKQANQPLSVKSIIEQLNAISITANKTTIYRIIKKLTEKNTISEITLNNGTTYYELSCSKHAHLICKKCNTVSCLDSTDILQFSKLRQVLLDQQFTLDSHEFNIYGSCNTCKATD